MCCSVQKYGVCQSYPLKRKGNPSASEEIALVKVSDMMHEIANL
jgi:hypothetical protein